MKIVGVSAKTFPIGVKGKIEYVEEVLNKIDSDTDLVVFPELFTVGYFPWDALYSLDLYNQQKIFLEKLKLLSKTYRTNFLVGGYKIEDSKPYNGAYLITREEVKFVAKKNNLPNYNVFSEKRYFFPGDELTILNVDDKFKLGILICEDLWIPHNSETLASKVDAIISINASPYTKEKVEFVKNKLEYKAKLYETPILYVNWYGGQDEIVFYTPSIVACPDAKTEMSHDFVYLNLTKKIVEKQKMNKVKEKRIAELDEYNCKKINTINVSLDVKESGVVKQKAIEYKPKNNVYEEIVEVLTLGIDSYFEHTHSDVAILGLSGGIDSAVVLGLLLRTKNIKRIFAYFLPSKYTSEESYEAVKKLAEYVVKNKRDKDVNIKQVPLEEITKSSLEYNIATTSGISLSKIAEENLQARIRGMFLATISNSIPNSLVIACGNKSEMSVGYATLYGDMVGGFAPLKDVYKTEVFEIAKVLDVPEFIINRKPSAELSEGQVDEDDLGYNYDELDKRLEKILDVDFVDKNLTKRVLRNEFKRRQAPPGIKIDKFSFTADRYFPINIDLF